jgi:peroxiredoxin
MLPPRLHENQAPPARTLSCAVETTRSRRWILPRCALGRSQLREIVGCRFRLGAHFGVFRRLLNVKEAFLKTRPVRVPNRNNLLLLGLAVLAIFQLSILAWGRGLEPELPATYLTVGEGLPLPRTTGSGGDQGALGDGEATVLLVFRSDCVHCQRVAPAWRDWLEASKATVDVLAVTSDPPDQARAFISQYGLDVEVISVGEDDLGGRAHALTTRTPWVFLLDGSGEIVAEGHGGQLGRAETALATKARAVAAQ